MLMFYKYAAFTFWKKNNKEHLEIGRNDVYFTGEVWLKSYSL